MRAREENQDLHYNHTSVELEIVKGDEKYKIERHLMFDGDGEAYERLHCARGF